MKEHLSVSFLLALWLGVVGAHGDVTLITLASFDGAHGAAPQAGLVEGADGNFYGTTSAGGAVNGGLVFKMNRNGALTTLASFWGGTNGYAPMAGLVQRKYDSSLYGTTSGIGGPKGSCGTVFRITTSGMLTTLCSFIAYGGAQPMAPLAEATDGNFYGTTEFGSVNSSIGNGTLFQMTFNGRFRTLHTFSNINDGAYPCAALVQADDGQFYDTTEQGGPNNAGTVFRTSSNGDVAILYSFTGAGDGYYPLGALVQGSDGSLYGTTQYGGTNDVADGGNGTIFKIDTNGTLTTLVSFDGASGANPVAALIQGEDGYFYGTTPRGGPTDNGTVFRMSPSGILTTLHSFSGSDGAAPMSALLQASDGSFYGTTSGGGAYKYGTVFRLSFPPALRAATKIAGGFSFAWNAVQGWRYQVECKTNLSQTNWAALGGMVTATNGTMTTFDPMASGLCPRWYRVALLP
jgi:uncharacterized repeat protein (TIGR03803 family)